jgi:hypothetical protein
MTEHGAIQREARRSVSTVGFLCLNRPAGFVSRNTGTLCASCRTAYTPPVTGMSVSSSSVNRTNPRKPAASRPARLNSTMIKDATERRWYVSISAERTAQELVDDLVDDQCIHFIAVRRWLRNSRSRRAFSRIIPFSVRIKRSSPSSGSCAGSSRGGTGSPRRARHDESALRRSAATALVRLTARGTRRGCPRRAL